MISFTAKNECETANFAKKIALCAKEGDFFALQGGLGAGKTLFAKAFAKVLGVQDEVTSPTYSLICEYDARLSCGKPLTLFHMDLYRLESEDDFEQIGGEECLASGGICLVEWSEKIPSLLKDAILVRLCVLPTGERQISLLSAEFEKRLG